MYLYSNSYSVDVAKVYGVRSAVFLSLLMNPVIEKTQEGKVVLERDLIFKMTGLIDSEQKDIEKALSEVNVIKVIPFRNNAEKNYYILNEETFFKYYKPVKELVESENTKSVNPVKKSVKRITKREMTIKKLKGYIDVENALLKQYLCDWVDAVYANPKGFLTKQSIEIAITELEAFSSDVDMQIELLRIAIKNGMRDITWAIQRYKKDNPVGTECWGEYNETKADTIQIENGAF